MIERPKNTPVHERGIRGESTETKPGSDMESFTATITNNY